jgi:hypothetical protein
MTTVRPDTSSSISLVGSSGARDRYRRDQAVCLLIEEYVGRTPEGYSVSP